MLPMHCEQPKPTDLDVDDDLSLELESDELFFMAEAASTLLPDLDQSRHSCCNQRHSHIRLHWTLCLSSDDANRNQLNK